MNKRNSPKHLQDIQNTVTRKLKLVKRTSSKLLDVRQSHHDEILEVYRSAFESLIVNTATYSHFLSEIKTVYEKAIEIRGERISQFITQDKLFGISRNRKERDIKITNLIKENTSLNEQIVKLNNEITQQKKDIGKLKDGQFSEYLTLAKERDARYMLYFENLALHSKLKELDGSAYSGDDSYGDPVVLRIALDRCREQLSATQREWKRMREEYAETVPRRDHDELSAQHLAAQRALHAAAADLQALHEAFKRMQAAKKNIEEELSESRERVSELERAGTPRPQWELCADFIGGGKDRWRQLACGLSSRDTLRVLLKELGPAAESDHLEFFDGLGIDPAIPPYLRYEGRVRNLRLSRREVSVIINDIWLGKQSHMDMTMQDYVTKYFEDRYQIASVRAEWAYNLCAGCEQTLDEPQVRVFWGALHAQYSEHVYWGLRQHWTALKQRVYQHAGLRETVTIEEFEKVAKAVFPLKSEVDIKNLSDAVRKQLKIKLNSNEINLEKLFLENEEGFDRVELARELFRQRQAAQDKYIREVVGELGGRAAPSTVTVDALKRAFAIVDPAIDHIRMDRNIRWAFSLGSGGSTEAAGALPLRALLARLSAGDIERVGTRAKARFRHHRRLAYK